MHALLCACLHEGWYHDADILSQMPGKPRRVDSKAARRVHVPVQCGTLDSDLGGTLFVCGSMVNSSRCAVPLAFKPRIACGTHVVVCSALVRASSLCWPAWKLSRPLYHSKLVVSEASAATPLIAMDTAGPSLSATMPPCHTNHSLPPCHHTMPPCHTNHSLHLPREPVRRFAALHHI